MKSITAMLKERVCAGTAIQINLVQADNIVIANP